MVCAGNGKVALRSMGKYVSAEDGGNAMNCNRSDIKAWEMFDWIPNSDGTFSLRGHNGKYVSSEGGKTQMKCNRDRVDAWEKFSCQSV